MKFTQEEISLCRQIAEKHRKKINEYGAWYIDKDDDRPVLAVGNLTLKSFICLWTISDCLEFLRERCKDHVLLIHEEGLEDDEEWYLWLDEYKETQQWGKGKTSLEACLKVVLAVLEEEK